MCVGDTLILIDNTINIPSILNIINSTHPHNQFNAKIEHNCKISFLDVSVMRFKSHFQTTSIGKVFQQIKKL